MPETATMYNYFFHKVDKYLEKSYKRTKPLSKCNYSEGTEQSLLNKNQKERI